MLDALHENNSLLPAELKTKEEGGLVLVRRSLGLTDEMLHVGNFSSVVFLISNRSHPPLRDMQLF